LYDIHQKKVAECDKRIETVLEQLKATRSTPAKPLPAQQPVFVKALQPFRIAYVSLATRHMQHGQRDSVAARATTSFRRIVHCSNRRPRFVTQ
jgi:hypothetical protein